MKLIGFAGKIGVGKDTAAEYFTSKDSRNVHLKFADGLRDVVAVLTGIYKEDKSHRSLFDDRVWKETYPLLVIEDTVFTPRVLLQKVGTECMRQGLHDNIWIAKVEQELENYPKANYVCISDVRYPNEYAWLRKHHASVLVYIESVDSMDSVNLLSSQVSLQSDTTHSSETFYDFLKARASIILENNKTSGLEAYTKKLETLYKIIESEEYLDYLDTERKIYV